MNQPVYFEDFEIGAVREFGTYAVTKDEILEFAGKYDPQPFHLSEEAGRGMHFGGLCASGWHTCAMVMRMIVDGMANTGAGSLGSPGVDELRWKKPVYPGDVLRLVTTVLDKRESRSRHDMGSVFLEYQVLNQKNEPVMSLKPIVMYKRRSPANQ